MEKWLYLDFADFKWTEYLQRMLYFAHRVLQVAGSDCKVQQWEDVGLHEPQPPIGTSPADAAAE